MFYVGLDVHQKTSSICILDGHGKVVKEKTLIGGWDVLLAELACICGPWCVVFEASCGYGVLYDKLAAIARKVVVAHPGELRLIFRSKKKNDRVDARKLATLLFMDQVPQVWVPNHDVRKWRELIEYRAHQVAKRTRTKNAIKALMRSCGIQKILPSPPARSPRGAGAPRKGSERVWTNKGMAILAALELPTQIDALRRDQLLDELEKLQRQINAVQKLLDDTANAHPGVALVMTIPGVGPRTAEAVVAYLDDPRRFGSLKKACAYTGLVPCQDASAGKERLGHITKEGPGTLRWLLTEAVWQGIRLSPTIKAHYEQLKRGQKNRSRIAATGTARWLVGVMRAMLISGESWRENDKITPVEKTSKEQAKAPTNAQN